MRAAGPFSTMGTSFPTNAERPPASGGSLPNWKGDYWYLIQNLVMKDFKIRYRNMSLGVFWSLLNPLVMMSVLWFVFTQILPARIPHYALFVLCGLVPFNVFAICWLNGTTSIIENSHLVKRVPVPREAIPIAAVLGNCLQLAAQVVLLLGLAAATGGGIHRCWWWLLAIWPLEVVFVTGLALMFSAFNVYVRDVRYVVESANVVLFWLVPIVYDFSWIPKQYHAMYAYNPVAAMVMALRNILIDHTAPAGTLLVKAALSSALMLVLGMAVFRRLRPKFYNYL